MYIKGTPPCALSAPRRAALRSLSRLCAERLSSIALAGIRSWRHRTPARRSERLAWVDPAAVRDARSWLEARLGPLSGYEVVTVLILMRADDHAVAPLDFATPAITVHPGPMQEKLPWFAPAVEEVFLTPEEVSALWTLPPIIEGSTCCPGLP